VVEEESLIKQCLITCTLGISVSLLFVGILVGALYFLEW